MCNNESNDVYVYYIDTLFTLKFVVTIAKTTVEIILCLKMCMI